MRNRLIITWSADVSTNQQRESFRNIKTKDAAKKIISQLRKENLKAAFYYDGEGKKFTFNQTQNHFI
jgi:hypothetical protein